MTIAWIFALGVSGIAAFTDLRTGRIPNWLTLPAALLGLGFHLASAGWGGLAWSFVGLLASGLVPAGLYRVTRGRGLGGGDVKLFSALGAWLGPARGLEVELSAFVILSVFALVILTFQGTLLRVLRSALRLLAVPFLPRSWREAPHDAGLTEMRLGPAIALAAWLVSLRQSELVSSWVFS